jgi:hypothetical protein
MGPHAKTLARMQKRVDELIESFERYATTFDESFDQNELFTGPSTYFHFKTLEIRRRHPSATQALQDDTFFEYLYATLTAWGLHRMGRTRAKLEEFVVLMTSFRNLAEKIQQVERFHIGELAPQEIPQVAQDLWEIISRLQVGVGETKIVAGSKALHHLLPELVPPIDRQYTLRFFYHHTSLNQGDEQAFSEMYPHFHHIARSCRNEIQSRLGTGMNTSPTKVIDNALVGYVLQHLK